MTNETILTPAQVDSLLDVVLRSSGSRLGNYTLQKTLDELRSAVRAIEQAVLQSTEIQELRDVLERCRFALEPYDDVKPRDWKTDRENLRHAHQAVCITLASMEYKK